MTEIYYTIDSVSYAVIIGGLGLLQAISVAVIAGLFNREARKRKADTETLEKRAALRAKESSLAMKLMSATASLSCATARAVIEGRVNGKTEDALKEAAKAQKEYYDFINGVASSQMATD